MAESPLCGKGEKTEEAGNTAERSHSHLHTFPEQNFTRQPYKTAGKYVVMGQPGVHPSSQQGRECVKWVSLSYIILQCLFN